MADLDAGCWQVKMNQASKEKTAFFMPNGKKHFNSMRMGATNTHAAFVAMASKFEIKWDKLYETRCKKGSKETKWACLKEKMEAVTKEMKRKRAKAENNKDQSTLPFPNDTSKPFEPMWQRPLETDPKPGSAAIVDDIILFAHTVLALLMHFICMVEILQHHQVTIKLRKTRFSTGHLRECWGNSKAHF
jgi:hypothetical protein